MPLRHSDDPDTMSNGEMDRVAISSFTVDRPGDYLLEARTSEFPSEVASVSVGRSSIRRVVLTFLVGVWLMVEAVVFGGATAIAVGGLRGRSKRDGLASGTVQESRPGHS